MNILITGSKGFVGQNLIAELKNRKYEHIFEYHRETEPELLEEYCQKADFVFHLAGVNRPKDQAEFMDVNYGLTETLLEKMKKYNNKSPIVISSSTHAAFESSYGISKRASEDLLFDYSKQTGAIVHIYRFPNIFGKWCKPNYNSAVATFCHNIANGLPITVNDPSVEMSLIYIDDVVEELLQALNGKPTQAGEYCEVSTIHKITLGEIADLIYSFKNSREERSIPVLSDALTKKLYSTYLSYLPESQFSYELKMNVDSRGSFTEFIKTPDRGQVSINVSKPGITKGNHWHHTKNEKFLVVSGKGVIRFRKIDSEQVIEYFVSGDKLEVVDIPVGYTHNIENLGDTDLVTVMWANEYFDPKKPDTYYLEV
ncbi:UDP-2-acetamido-2,6-beta-L-arabino-hexul-4-ose reductase [Paenibacillus phyllosphaerae]|uniref:UDP-2-acetamido-2,6-beta-L-arabino-hexul-4-ose reductase n=1 Tax=Paenibacillus phyllosphaerae TaxID=274593 RepID=A0A7W5FMX8_9BACL|nr:capsular polysaccharide biosynthesis protein CapF [Paenibacillus phyllosphaerae]MBB3110562.1 UDP-2-acetamido-2,6-beta-L-arabino-hexul-4-ose reductase [Paenibacillus phyllosphaerae]